MTEELSSGVAAIVTALFDREKYLRLYPDVGMLGIDPLEHYLCIGRHLGRSPGFDLERMLNGQHSNRDAAVFHSFGTIEHDPLISLLIVSYNSSNDLYTLFQSIVEQTYVNFEVVLIENGVADTEPLLRQFFPHGHFSRADNVGFAEGNNLAMEMSQGELVALVNPDTRLAPDMLQNLLDSLRFDTGAAVAVPRISFFERFVQVRIRADKRFSILRQQILDGLDYHKLFTGCGSDDGDFLHSDKDGVLTLNLPYERPRQIEIELRGGEPISFCETQIGYGRPSRAMQPAALTFGVKIDFTAANCANARQLVNNAGSMFRSDGTPFDRGFGEFDDGRYMSKAYVEALCGCAALIRRSAILDRTIFFGPNFAYYEDTELSRWLTSRGYRIIYQPTSQVFHRHSESTDERSLSRRVLVERGRQIYDIVSRDLDADISSFSVNYPEEFVGPLRTKLETFDETMRAAGVARALIAPRRRTACVYDSYFSSMGGGEKHALDIAALLRNDFDVYLVSENDFDIGEMEAYFAVDLSGIRKIICGVIDTHFTSKFDLFVNSTFLSNLLPAAKENLYVVSFPQKHLPPAVRAKYRFLHNSRFTRSWAYTYWGEHLESIVLPILGQSFLTHDFKESSTAKEKILLSVGRFTYGGHCKNHHLVAAAFKNLVAAKRIPSGWRLEIVGSCDLSHDDAVEYCQDLLLATDGYPITVRPNAGRDDLNKIYASCAIYVHAAGLGSPQDRPELLEHFGISTFEALVNGCVPVVYSCGGPAEQISELPVGGTFSDAAELEQAILGAIAAFEAQGSRADSVRNHAVRMMKENSAAFQDVLKTIAQPGKAKISGREGYRGDNIGR